MYYSLEYDVEAVEEYDKVQEKMLLEDYDSPGPETPTDTMPVGVHYVLSGSVTRQAQADAGAVECTGGNGNRSS